MKIIYKKDTKAYCKHCMDYVFQFNKDIYSGDKISATQIYQNEGQAPWRNGEQMICRKCKKNFNESSLIFDQPICYVTADIKESDIVSIDVQALNKNITQLISKTRLDQ